MDFGAASRWSEGPQGGRARVWAVGGGKGGVGKSVITSSLAMSLAGRGQRCVVIDADLGGANLHTVLGLPAPRRTLSHFFTGEVKQLEDVACPGPVPNLSLISGARALAEMANPSHPRKEKLLRHIQRLDADHVFLDLGAGSSFTVLDFFLTASRGILVVVPEPTSIENAYHFLKAVYFRTLRQAAQRAGMLEELHEALRQRSQRLASPRALREFVQQLDPRAGALLEEQARRFRPMLLLNQVRTVEHRRIGPDIAIACREYLGAEIDYLGALERDECVRAAISERAPVLTRFPGSPFSRDVELLAGRLLQESRPHDAGSSQDPGCSFRPGRQLYGRSALAVSGLADAPDDEELEPVESAPEPVARALAQAASPAPEPQPTAAAAPPCELPPLDLDAPGEYLRRCRLARGLELGELTRRLRILCLDAIERERFEAVPPEPFLRGFVKSYAEALGIERPDALAAAFVGRYRTAARKRRLEERGHRAA